MATGSLITMFAHELGSLLGAEHEFLASLRWLVGQAQDPTLKAMLQEHIEQTEGQIGNLEQVFLLLHLPVKRVPCAAAAGLVADGQTLLREAVGAPALLDGAIATAQAKVEHLEVGCYRSLVAGAELMGQPEVLRLLTENLRQEERALGIATTCATTLLQKAHASGLDGGPGIESLHADRSGQPAGPMVGNASGQSPTDSGMIGMGAGEAGARSTPIGGVGGGAAGAAPGAGLGPGATAARNALAAGRADAADPARSVASPDEIAAGVGDPGDTAGEA